MTVFIFHEISNMDIVNVIDSLHAKSSSGKGGISTKLLKLIMVFGTEVLTKPKKVFGLNSSFI